MVLVEIEVPVLEKRYDFKLNVEEKVGDLMKEILHIICQREHCVLQEKTHPFLLGDLERHILFHPEHRLEDYGVETGSRLVLL